MRSALLILLLAASCGRVNFAPVVSDGAANDITDADEVTAPSCVGLAPTCGPAADGSCCESPVVPGGPFDRSYDVSGDGNFADAGFPASVSTFRLDKYEVTVGRFRTFLASSGGAGTQANPPVSGAGARPLNGMTSAGGWDATLDGNLTADSAALTSAINCDATFQTWTDAPGPNENRPINCITWEEAFAFCIWDGGFLPTEAESMYAASGGAEQRAFPWSQPASSLSLDSTRASYSDGTNCNGDGAPACTVTDFIPVGSKPAGDGRWGQADLGGNVWEWARDYFEITYQINPCDDCSDVALSSFHILRGGGALGTIDDASDGSTGQRRTRSGNRNYGIPSGPRLPVIGVRCARAL